jgi:hypothetical protein
MNDVDALAAATTETPALADSIFDTEAFWDRHAVHVWGVNAREMVHSRTADVSASGVIYEHHSQFVQGRRVFGGEVVLARDGQSNVVLRARGHPMPTKAMMDDGGKRWGAAWGNAANGDTNGDGGAVVAEALLTAEEAVDRVRVALLRRAGAAATRTDTTDTTMEDEAKTQVHLEVAASEVMWYRLGLVQGAPSGGVVLAYVIDVRAHVDGAEAGRDMFAGRAIVDASTGRVMSLVNQAGIRGAGKKGDASRQREGVLSSGRKQHRKAQNAAQWLKGTSAIARAVRRRLDADPQKFKIFTYDCSGGICGSTPYYKSRDGNLNSEDDTTQLGGLA